MMVQLLLSCRALSSPTLYRFIPALSQRPPLRFDGGRAERGGRARWAGPTPKKRYPVNPVKNKKIRHKAAKAL